MSENQANAFRSAITYAATRLGGYVALGRLCGVTSVSVNKWRRIGHLPRTDYTGETRYGEIIAHAVGEPDLIERLRFRFTPQHAAVEDKTALSQKDSKDPDGDLHWCSK